MVRFKVLSGGANGTDHIDTGTNGQDARSVKQSSGSLVVAVADGCSSKPHSGVGAEFFAHLCTTYFAQAIRRGQDITDIRVRRHVRDRLTAKMTDLANDMAGDETVAEVLADYFLFTLLVAIVANGKLYILRIGDGVYGVNGKITKLQPTAGNKPIYLAYAILGSRMTDKDPDALDFEIVEVHDIRDVDTFWIGTDGIEEMLKATGKVAGDSKIEAPEALLTDPRYHDKPNLLSERLVEISAAGFGNDDLSFVGAQVIHESAPAPTTPDETAGEEVAEPGKAVDQPIESAGDSDEAADEESGDA